MNNHDLIRNLKDQSTWRLLGLGLITYGVYFAYYVKKQTGKINGRLDKDAAISDGFVNSFFIMSYVSAALFIPYLFVDDGHPIESIGSIADTISGILLVVWGFKARNRVNNLCSLDKKSGSWFHGVWTFLFTPLYFNYKINRLSAENNGGDGVIEIKPEI